MRGRRFQGERLLSTRSQTTWPRRRLPTALVARASPLLLLARFLIFHFSPSTYNSNAAGGRGRTHNALDHFALARYFPVAETTETENVI